MAITSDYVSEYTGAQIDDGITKANTAVQSSQIKQTTNGTSSTDIVSQNAVYTSLASKASNGDLSSAINTHNASSTAHPLLVPKSDIVDNLTSTDTDKPLSANQGKLLKDELDALQGSLVPQGNWNADTNTPDISSTTETGYYWVVSVAGSTDLGGITDWGTNDWAIKSASGWLKIDNSEKVTSVNGEVGDVVLDAENINYNEDNTIKEILDEKQKNNIYGIIDPTTSTIGIVGQLYFNSENNTIWKCTGYVDPDYIWELIISEVDTDTIISTIKAYPTDLSNTVQLGVFNVNEYAEYTGTQMTPTLAKTLYNIDYRTKVYCSKSNSSYVKGNIYMIDRIQPYGYPAEYFFSLFSEPEIPVDITKEYTLIPIGENDTFRLSESSNFVCSYIVGETPLALDWLSLEESGSALTPVTNKIYIIKTIGDYYNKQYTWNGVEFELISGGIIEVIDNLTSTSTTSALSANQGRILQNQKVGGATIYGGTIIGNLNTIEKSGFYTCFGTATGVPNSTYSWFVLHENSNAGVISAKQTATAYNGVIMTYERVKTSSTWGDWIKITTAQDTKTYTTTLPTTSGGESDWQAVTGGYELAKTISGLTAYDSIVTVASDDTIWTDNELNATITADTLTFFVSSLPSAEVVLTLTITKSTNGGTI